MASTKRGLIMSLTTEVARIVSGLARIGLYNRYALFLVSPLIFLTGVRPGKPKDLKRPYPAACPACRSNDILRIAAVPYYKTHLVHWGSCLSIYNEIVDPVYKLVRFDLYDCQNCGLVFVPESYKGLVENVENHPLFFEKVAEPYLSQTQPVITSSMVSNIVVSPVENLTLIEGTFKQLFSIIVKYRKEITKYLDFGSNMGAFAEFVRIALPDSDVRCSEINQHYVAKCKERYPQLTIIDRPLTSDSATEKFDFIYCSDVIEHIWDPDELFSAFWCHLRENGLLMLVTPNGDSQSAKRKGVWWWSYIVPHHAQVFNLSSLNALVKRFNFHLVQHGEIGEELFIVCRKNEQA